MNREKMVVQVLLYKQDLRILQTAGQVEKKTLSSQICAAVHEHAQRTLKRNPKIAEQLKFNDVKLRSLFSKTDKSTQATAKVLTYKK